MEHTFLDELPMELKKDAMKRNAAIFDPKWDIVDFISVYGEVNFIDGNGDQYLFTQSWFIKTKDGLLAVWPKDLPYRFKKFDLKFKKKEIFYKSLPKFIRRIFFKHPNFRWENFPK